MLVNNQIGPDTFRILARYHAQMHCRDLSPRLLLDAHLEVFGGGPSVDARYPREIGGRLHVVEIGPVCYAALGGSTSGGELTYASQCKYQHHPWGVDSLKQ